MKQQIQLGQTLATLTLAGVALSTVVILQNPSQPSPTSSDTVNATLTPKTAGVKQTVASYGLPVRLKIPKIDVDTPIDQMGLTPEGDMQAPSDSQHVGWYKFGSRPGDTGSAVIAGHFGPRRDGKISIFDSLHTLSHGDPLYVEDEHGATATFIVQKFQMYEPNEAAPNVFSSSDGQAHLNIITCQGTWDTAQQTYSNRLVLFADKKAE